MKQSISKNLPKLHFFQFCKSILCNPFLFFSVGNQVAGLQTNGGSRPHDLKRLHELIITTTLLLEILISVSVIWGIIKYTYSLIEKKIILKSLLVVMGWVRFFYPGFGSVKRVKRQVEQGFFIFAIFDDYSKWSEFSNVARIWQKSNSLVQVTI